MILHIEEYPDWKSRVLRFIGYLMGIKGKYVLFADIDPGGDVEYTPHSPCNSCEGTGRLMTVMTYTTIDCPRCYGRG